MSGATPAAPRGRAYVVAVLFFLSVLQAFDRNIAFVVNEPVRREWALSDAELGALAGAFMGFYAVAGLPLGRLVDRARRTRLLAGALFLWSLFTAACGLAQSFATLLAARVAVGVGEAVGAPGMLSLLGDLFPARQRARAIAAVMAGIPIAVALSFALGGAVAKAAGWRAAFFIAAAPGIVCSFALLFAREPARGGAEEHAVGAARRPGAPFAVVLKVRTMWTILAANTLHFFIVSAFGAFAMPFLMRYHGLTIERAGAVVGLTVGLAPILGLAFGSIVSDALRKRRPDAPLLVAGGSMAVAVPLFAFALAQPRGHVGAFAALLAAALTVLFPVVSLGPALIHEVVEPSLRGTAVAVNTFATNVLGATGPLALGALSDALARAAVGVTAPSEEALEPFRPDALHEALWLLPAVAAVIAVVLLTGLGRARRDITDLGAWMREVST